MSATAGGELTATELIASLQAGLYPHDVILTMARGFLPLEQKDLIVVLVWLASSGDAEVAELALTSLFEVPPRAHFEYASDEQLAPEHLIRFLGLTSDPIILEALIRNRSVPDDAVVELSRTAEARVQDVIVINQARILRAPAILDALLANPALSPDARRRAMETHEEFFVKRARLADEAVEEEKEEEVIDAPLEAIADLLERAGSVPDPEAAAPLPLTESEKNDPRSRAVWARLQFMSISEKVQLAYRGDRTTRMFLIRERNKLICTAVMRNPRMSETEVESIAGMRNVEDEVLRLVSMRRDWMAKYNIMLTLVRNPKCPLGVVLPFVNRLTLRDLKGLKDDKGVQQVVREMAKKAYLARALKAG